MGTEYYTLVEFSTIFGIVRWIMAALLVMIVILFLVKPPKDKRKFIGFIGSLVASIILIPMLLLAPNTKTIKPTPVDPIPQTEPEPTPEPEPDVIEPVAPPKTDPENNTTPSAPSEPNTPNMPDMPDEPEASATYTVIHRQQNLNDDDYSTIESETGTGTAGKEVTPATKTYTGFIAPTTVTVTVAEDNSTEVVYDYNREIIDLAVDDSDLYIASLPNDGYKYGTEVTLTAKDRTGYVFNGWSNGATTNTVTVTLGADEIPEPTYEANAYRIVFNKNSNEATGSMTAQVLTYDQQEQINANSFTLPGYSFDHWNTKDDDSGDSFTDGQSVKNLASEGDVDFYAFWTPNANTPYTVKHYKMNIGGSGYTVAETEPKTGTTDTEVTPEHKEYTGFTPDSAQTKKITGDGEMLIEYYYSRNQYTITFGENAASITSDDFVSGQSYYYEQTGTITAGNKTGYTFESWTDGSTDISRSFTMGAANATIGANYRANTYSVIFHANYPNSSATTSRSFTYDQAATALNANSFDRVGYDFSHWDTKADDSGSEYTDGAEVQNLTDVDGGEYHLYAQWTARNDTRYTVYKDLMNLNGEGYVLDRQGTVYTGTSDAEITVTPTDINGFDLPASQTITIAADGSTEVRFRYVRQKRKLTLRDEEYIETETPSDDYYYGTYITLVAKERDGYTFVNWNGNSSSTNPTVQFNLHYNETYRPIYQANTYSIVFDKNATDATGSMMPQQMTYDQAADLSANQFERNNFTFKGWSTNPNATTKEYSDGDSVINLATSGDITLYAVWEDKFPVVFSIEGDCIFNGKTGTITTTSACQFDGTDFVGQTFIDTGISLNTEENFDKDYEISFNIDNYSPNGQEPQTTFVSNKISTSHSGAFIIDPNTGQRKKGASSPGVVVRMSGENIDTRSALYNSDETGYDEVGYAKNYTEIQSVKLVRHNRVIYASVNGGNLFELQDVSSYHQYFNQTTWFGAYPDDGSDNPAPKRVLIGTLSNLSIRLGEMDWNYYEVKFNPKNGNLDASYKKMYVEKGLAIDPLPTTTRSKYVFTGWHIGSTKIEGSYTPSEDVEIKANWLRDVTNSVVTTASLDLIKGEEANLTFSALGTAEPFTLSSSDESIATVDQNGKVTAIAKGQANIILTGNLSGKTKAVPVTVSLPKYTIHFDSKGGNEIADITDVEEGSTITLPTQPTRTGFVFDGWFLENTDTEFTANTPIMNNANVEARWLKDVTQLSITNPNIEIEVGGSAKTIQLSNTDNMEPFSFASDNDAIATVNQSGDVSPISAGQTTITITGQRSGETVPIVATVLSEKVQLTFDDQMGHTNTSQLRIGEILGSLASDLSCEHYIFEGWYTDSTGGEKVSSSTTVTGQTTYYAHWTKTVYHLTIIPGQIDVDKGYVANFEFGDTSGMEGFTYHIENEEIASVDSTAVTGITTGTTHLIIEGEESSDTKSVDVIVHPHMVTVTFDYSDGTTAITTEIEEGNTFAELPTKIRENYYLEGWFTQANGQGTKLTTSTQIQSQGNSNCYYAYWLASINTATISPAEFNLEVGGTGTISVSNSNEQLEPFSFSSSNDVIASVDEQGVVTANAAGDATITISGDKTGETQTVSIVVIENVTAIFDNNDGTIEEERIINKGSALGDLPTPDRGDDYYFQGWFTESDGGNTISNNTTIIADTTYYAHWKYMPIAWSNIGACTFAPEANTSTGKTTGHVSGENCDYTGQEYIDTGVALYSAANVAKDYEVYFEIDSYDQSDKSNSHPNGQIGSSSDDKKQQTFFNAKDVINSHGLIIRRDTSSAHTTQVNSNTGGTGNKTIPANTRKIKINRRGGNLYITINDGDEEPLHEGVSANTDPFPLTAWFGAYPDKGSYTTPQATYGAKRFITATLSNMYIRLETEEPRKPENVITFKTSSDAIEDYYASVDTWNANENEGEFLEAMKGNFDSHQCKYSAKDDLSEDFPANYKYGNGSNYCDRPDTYDTGVNGAVSVYRVINETTGEKENTPVTYADGSNGKITNLIPGEMYYWESDANPEAYGFIKAEGTRRIISLPSARNARDLGGLTGQNGKKLKYGILLRGEQLGTGDVSVLQGKLGIDYEYELRGGSSNQSGSHFEGDARKNKQVYNYNFNYGISPHYETTKASLISLMQDIIAGNSIYLHCSHGADRAGTLAYLAEALLGVDYETRTRDYELTTFSGRPDKTRYYDHKGTPPFNVADNVEFHPGRKYKWMTTFAKTNEQVIEWFKADLTTDEEKQEADNLIEQFRAAALEGYND